MGKRREVSLTEYIWERIVAELGITGKAERKVGF